MYSVDKLPRGLLLKCETAEAERGYQLPWLSLGQTTKSASPEEKVPENPYGQSW